MRKLVWIVGLMFIALTVLSSCRSSKQACAAYSKADHTVVSPDTPS